MSRTLDVLVEDRPDVLNRVTSLFRRRAFEIESLNFARTDEPGLARIVVAFESDDAGLNRVVAYLERLVDVVRVEARGAQDPD
jgi:acetolactate synthase-1/3 small subunit